MSKQVTEGIYDFIGGLILGLFLGVCILCVLGPILWFISILFCH